MDQKCVTKKIEDFVKHNIEDALKGQLKNVNDLFY